MSPIRKQFSEEFKLELNRTARQENQRRVEEMLQTIGRGNATGALWQMLNERATHLQVEGERLKREERQLSGEIANFEIDFDAQTFKTTLCDFKKLASVAEPEELQKLIRLAVRRIEWMPEGVHRIQFYYLPKTKKPLSNGDRSEFATNVRSGGPDRIRTGDLFRDREACWATTPRVH